ncbi:MAG: ZIP family metal transporter [Bacteroidota bacterium]
MSFIILFALALLSGLLAFRINNVKNGLYKLSLVFAGAYLFAVTIIHILPELFYSAANPTLIGIYVLLGFFLQQILEYFSTGAEHGHIHKHNKAHRHSKSSVIPIMVALSIHAILEGTLLAHPSSIHEQHDSSALLLGIALHKGPAAFALTTILLCYLTNKRLVIILLVLFALASPLGILIGNYIVNDGSISQSVFNILFGLLSGSFLHISTTIVFESSTDHSFNLKKLSVAILGALIAVGAEYWF